MYPLILQLNHIVHLSLRLSHHYSRMCILDEGEYHIFWIVQKLLQQADIHIQAYINLNCRLLNTFRFPLKVQSTIPHTSLKDIGADCFLRILQTQPACLLKTVSQQHPF